jgi:nucleotide-binding universal stress UspA family protein
VRRPVEEDLGHCRSHACLDHDVGMDVSGRIVVGVDGSRGAEQALRWAAEEGRIRGAEVCALLAWSFLDQHAPPAGEEFTSEYSEEDARRALAAYVARALPGGDDPICQCVVNELPARALLDAGREASLLVVGARGLGGFRGLLLGSVSQRCAHLTSTPLVVVRQPVSGARRGIVVGVDESDASASALHWAVEEGRRRHQPVRALHAWHEQVLGSDAFAMTVDPGPWERAAGLVLDAVVTAEDDSQLPNPIDHELVNGGAAGALVEASSGAQLVVVGNRGHNTLALGSVAHQVLHHAHCPVALIPPSSWSDNSPQGA